MSKQKGMGKPKLLDLFCCGGGTSVGYSRAGFAVYGIDNRPQPHYPFPFLLMDAMEAMDRLLRGEGLTFSNGETLYMADFVAYHASPPCQHYTMMQHMTKNRESHPDLISATREMLNATRKPYIIENVYKSPLKGHLMLCGTMFGLQIVCHRFFECNGWMELTLLPPCDHRDVYDKWHGWGDGNSIGERERTLIAKGIDWFMTRPEVREAIPPAYTEYIGKYLLDALRGREKQ